MNAVSKLYWLVGITAHNTLFLGVELRCALSMYQVWIIHILVSKQKEVSKIATLHFHEKNVRQKVIFQGFEENWAHHPLLPNHTADTNLFPPEHFGIYSTNDLRACNIWYDSILLFNMYWFWQCIFKTSFLKDQTVDHTNIVCVCAHLHIYTHNL